eukprot:IDg8767t1
MRECDRDARMRARSAAIMENARMENARLRARTAASARRALLPFARTSPLRRPSPCTRRVRACSLAWMPPLCAALRCSLRCTAATYTAAFRRTRQLRAPLSPTPAPSHAARPLRHVSNGAITSRGIIHNRMSTPNAMTAHARETLPHCAACTYCTKG